MTDPLVSIVIPVYNPEIVLFEKCIESTLNQTYQNLEIILVNDGSIDAIMKLCDSFKQIDQRIKVIHKRNEGVSSARNKGVELAKGEYIVFLDSDDMLDKKYIEELVQNIGDFDILCTGHTKLFNSQSEKHEAYNWTNKYNIDVLGTVWGKMFRASILKNNLFNENIIYCEDIEFNFRILKDATYKYYPCYGYFYRYLPNSTVRSFNNDMVKKYLDTIHIIKSYDLDSQQIKAFHVFVSTIYRVIVENYVLTSNKKFFNQLKEIKVIAQIPEFNQSLKLVELNQFSFTRRLPILFAKYKAYLMVYLVIYIRKLQYRLYYKKKGKK